MTPYIFSNILFLLIKYLLTINNQQLHHLDNVPLRIFYLFLLTITALSLQAQDFQLYFANNVSDVSNLRSIRKSNKLNWQLVTNGALATNKVQVEGVKSMFASTDMKGRAQQQQFWKYINPREQQLKDIRAWQSGDRNESLKKRIGAITEKYGSLDATKIQAEVDADVRLGRISVESAVKPGGTEEFL